MKVKPTQAELAAAQLREWPDSKLLSISDALKWIAEAHEPTPADVKEIEEYCKNFTDCNQTPEERRNTKREAIAHNMLTRATRSRGVALHVAVALANAVDAGTPVQFYLCCLDSETGKYRCRGCRFGVEGSEYASLF